MRASFSFTARFTLENSTYRLENALRFNFHKRNIKMVSDNYKDINLRINQETRSGLL